MRPGKLLLSKWWMPSPLRISRVPHTLTACTDTALRCLCFKLSLEIFNHEDALPVIRFHLSACSMGLFEKGRRRGCKIGGCGRDSGSGGARRGEADRIGDECGSSSVSPEAGHCRS